MSNIRQRRGPSPSRDSFGHSSISWEIGNDDSADRGRTTARNAIPMYNPTNLQSSLSNSPSSLSATHSHRVSWNTIMEAKRANSDFLREVPMAKTYHDSTGYYHSIKGNEYDEFQSGRRLSSMAPALVPDSAYRGYLSGRPAQKGKQSGVDKIQIAKILGYFAIVGFLFLTFVGILIDTQPMYLQGILEKNQEVTSDGKKVRTFYAVSIHERLEPAKHAYRGGLLYLLTAAVCFGYAYNVHHYVFKKGWQQYRDIDDVASTVPTFGGIDGYLPTTGAVHRKAYEGRTGILFRTWHTTSITVQRIGFYMSSVWQARRRNRRRFAGAKDV
mmetsp:Transcript_24299/g.57359  ORF Transcript_24299/g.57359 Transcript_24299/m.57359 type:complete len:328 (+) Transcript_24299:483-1466(+)